MRTQGTNPERGGGVRTFTWTSHLYVQRTSILYKGTIRTIIKNMVCMGDWTLTWEIRYKYMYVHDFLGFTKLTDQNHQQCSGQSLMLAKPKL